MAHAEDDGDVEYRYGEANTFEIGGSLGAELSNDLILITVTPSFGYFVIDYFELSAAFEYEYERFEDEDTGMDITLHSGSLVLEPSYHQPLSKRVQLLGGVGPGVGHDGDYFDFRIVPRAGVNILTTRSVVITPAVEVPIKFSKSYGSNGDVGTDVVVEINIGISATW